MSHCGYCENRLRALVDGELEPRESTQVLAHLEGCAECRRAYGAIQATASLLQDQPLEDAPPHFTASLQVRLSAHRHRPQCRPSIRQALRNLVPAVPARPSLPTLRWVGGVTTVLALSLTCMFVTTSRSIGATEVARRAEESWMQVRNYGCVFVSTGIYQGQPRSFTQRQFFRRPGDFRLETTQDYPLTTFVRDDSLIHYIPGGQWNGQGPVVIVRPRGATAGALPFPFGATWQSGGNVSLDQLIRQLREQHQTHLVGTERIGERECYRLAFTDDASSANPGDRYELWVDRETFIPRRVSWYRDEQNHIVTEAQELQVNYDLLPRDTFDFRIPDGAFVVYGDVDPHVLALPFRPERTVSFDREPLETAQLEAWRRSSRVPFPVLSPGWLPDGYRLVRVRSKSGRWVDSHWLREGTEGGGQVLKLVQHDGRLDLPESWREGDLVKLGTGEDAVGAYLLRRESPYPYRVLTWNQGPTRLTLFAAGLDSESIIRIAESLQVATSPPPSVRVAEGHTDELEFSGEPSMLPFELEAGGDPDLNHEGLYLFREQMPMLPEQPDDDPAPERATVIIR
jgi:outer membrane lipoprotein-sorting protein